MLLVLLTLAFALAITVAGRVRDGRSLRAWELRRLEARAAMSVHLSRGL